MSAEPPLNFNNGRDTPLPRIADALGVPPTSLFDGI